MTQVVHNHQLVAVYLIHSVDITDLSAVQITPHTVRQLDVGCTHTQITNSQRKIKHNATDLEVNSIRTYQLMSFWQGNVVKYSMCYQNVCPSVYLSVTLMSHT